MTSSSAVRVLFVCMGNICRSPTAEAVMKKMISQQGLDHAIIIDSAGTIGYHEGSGSDARAVSHGTKRGYVFDHKARRVVSADFHDFDYIVAMDHENLAELRRMAPKNNGRSQISLLMRHCKDAAVEEVPDPYYGGAGGFEEVLNLVEAGCSALLDKIRAEHWLR
jgi:protein-tyrosine phosphatase